MAITAKVRNKQIETGKVLHALVQGEHASGNITFQIIGETELVEDFNSTYFYLLYTRPSDTRPNVLLLTNKQLQDDVISVTFKPTSYFTAQDGTVQIQIMATDTEGLSVDSETGTISGSIIWQTFPGAMFVHASQLTGTETIIEENVLTQYLAGMQDLNTATEQAAEGAQDAAEDAGDSAEAAAGSATAAQDAKSDAEAARDKAAEWAEKETAVETGKYSAKHWAEQAHAEFNAIDTYVDETLKPALDDYEAAKEAELDTYEGTKETELNTHTGTKKTELDTYTGAKKSELDSYVADTNKPALDNYTTAKKEELDGYVDNTSKPSIDDYVDDTTKPAIDDYVDEDVKPALDEYVENVLSQDIEEDDTTHAPSADAVYKELIKKANKDGSYATLISGLAMNLVGKGTVGAEISFRTAGGTADIGSGSARLDKIKGNSVNRNQLLQNGNFSSGIGWNEWLGIRSVSDGVMTLTANASGSVSSVNINHSISIPKGHYVLIAFDIMTDRAGNYHYYLDGGFYDTVLIPTANSWTKVIRIISNQQLTQNSTLLYLYGYAENSSVTKFKNVLLRDLTLRFGAGNEPTLQQIQSNYPELLKYSDYDAGSTDSFVGTGLETTGFNQWDEEWEIGGFYQDTGGKNNSITDRIRSANYIPVFPNTTYYFHIGADKGVYVRYYDADNKAIGTLWNASNIKNTTFTTTSDTAYIRFMVDPSYGTTYNHDICINLSWSGIRNGESEEYWKSTLNLPITTVTGKQTGSETSEVIFPSGMNKIDDVYDELTAKKAVKRINKINLGTLNWSYVSSGAYFKVVTSVPELGKLLCNQYDAKASATYAISPSNLGSAPNMSIYRGGGDVTERKTIYLKNTSKTASDLIARTGTGNAAWLDDVWLYYSGDTPIEYTLDEELNLNYRVDDFGTEKLLPTTGTAPLLADIAYAMNAVDQLRRMSVNYDNTASLDNLCASLGTALSAALNGTFTITRGAYDENTQTYAFSTSFTPNE